MIDTRSPSSATKALMPTTPGMAAASSSMRAASGSYSASTPTLSRERNTTTTLVSRVMRALLLRLAVDVHGLVETERRRVGSPRRSQDELLGITRHRIAATADVDLLHAVEGECGRAPVLVLQLLAQVLHRRVQADARAGWLDAGGGADVGG